MGGFAQALFLPVVTKSRSMRLLGEPIGGRTVSGDRYRSRPRGPERGDAPGRVRIRSTLHTWPLHQEALKESYHYRFEIEYQSDGTVTGYYWNRAFYPDGTPKDWRIHYTATWTLSEHTLKHSWIPRDKYDCTAPDPAECDILEPTRSDMRLRDKAMGFLLFFHRKFRFVEVQTPNHLNRNLVRQKSSGASGRVSVSNSDGGSCSSLCHSLCNSSVE